MDSPSLSRVFMFLYYLIVYTILNKTSTLTCICLIDCTMLLKWAHHRSESYVGLLNGVIIATIKTRRLIFWLVIVWSISYFWWWIHLILCFSLLVMWWLFLNLSIEITFYFVANNDFGLTPCGLQLLIGLQFLLSDWLVSGSEVTMHVEWIIQITPIKVKRDQL